jgi:hypothetical protein
MYGKLKALELVWVAGIRKDFVNGVGLTDASAGSETA